MGLKMSTRRSLWGYKEKMRRVGRAMAEAPTFFDLLVGGCSEK